MITANYKRSQLSKLIEEVTIYANDIERITLLRDKAFKHWTLEGRKESQETAKAEWERYNNILEVMQLCLLRIHDNVLREKKVKK